MCKKYVYLVINNIFLSVNENVSVHSTGCYAPSIFCLFIVYFVYLFLFCMF